jgi:fructose/tagatose bisphosphate aldolase
VSLLFEGNNFPCQDRIGKISMTELNGTQAFLDGSLLLSDGRAAIADANRLRSRIHRLAETAALEPGPPAEMAHYLARMAALELGIFPATIQPLYMARGRGEIPLAFTVPALNLRALTFEAARAAFRAAISIRAGTIIFEISRAEITFTSQRPADFATGILAAAIVEGHQGPIFLQGDHFQVSARRYAQEPQAEVEAVRQLSTEAIQAGFYNLDIDASTLVDLSREKLAEQQDLNQYLTAELAAFIRSIEPPGVTVSVGGEIGEVGGHNSTEGELRAFMDGCNESLRAIDPGAAGLSKISIQTGTSHGGVMLPDGRLAKARVDFETIRRLGAIARNEYGMGGVVQHGASTLPVEAFPRFVEAGAAEIHLATSFTLTLFERLPAELKQAMYRYLDENMARERLPGMTSQQFYHKFSKYALGPFKTELCRLDEDVKEQIGRAWESQFLQMFRALGLEDTGELVQRWVPPLVVQPSFPDAARKEYTFDDAERLAE